MSDKTEEPNPKEALLLRLNLHLLLGQLGIVLGHLHGELLPLLLGHSFGDFLELRGCQCGLVAIIIIKEKELELSVKGEARGDSGATHAEMNIKKKKKKS